LVTGFLSYTDKLEKIDIADNNPVYMDIDGICYSKDGKILIAHPQAKDATNYELPNTVEEIRKSALNGTNIKEFIVPPTVKKLGPCVFSGCKELTTVSINSTINKVIEEDLFYDCTKLTTVTMPSEIERIKLCAFYGCTSLRMVTLPYNLQVIEASAFNGCSSLGEIEIRENVTTIGYKAFCRTDARIHIANLAKITFIDDFAFSTCTFDDDSIKQQILSINPNAIKMVRSWSKYVTYAL